MKISVITAVRNGEAHLAEALNSVLAQDHPDLELIVVAGTSSDQTAEIIKRYVGLLDCVVYGADLGVYDALNRGVRLATGDVVGFLHADDCFADRHILSRVAEAMVDPSVGACYGDLRYLSRDDPSRVVRHWRAGAYRRSRLSWGWMPPHPTFYVRGEIYRRFGGYDQSYKIAGDYELMLRLLASGKVNPVYIPDVLVDMRLGGISNDSTRHLRQKSCEDYRALRQHRVGGLGALAFKVLRKIPQFIFKGRSETLGDTAWRTQQPFSSADARPRPTPAWSASSAYPEHPA